MFYSEKQLFFIAFLFLSLTFAISAQEQKLKPVKEGFGVSERPLSCEMTFQLMHKVRKLIQVGSDEKSVLILIARRGDGEKSKTLNSRRLANVRDGLEVTLGVVKPIVAAEGETTQGFGRVEVYLDGKFIGAFLARKNSAIIKCDM